jgi:hypothetical protein
VRLLSRRRRVRRHLRDRYDAELLFTHDLGWSESTRVAPGQWYE